ncbi:hypothetical protein ACVWY3_002323 [Bradyrhizobium sp. USDA 4486]
MKRGQLKHFQMASQGAKIANRRNGPLMRFVPVLLGLLLSACSSFGLWPDTSSTPPPAPATAGPPSQDAIQKGVARAIAETKLTKPVEISDVRKARVGPGAYLVCLREVNPPPGQPLRVYSVFFNDDYVSSRLSVILEECEKQQFTLVN